MSGERGCDLIHVGRRIPGDRTRLGIIDPARGVFDVVHIPAQAPQAEQVVQELIGHARERVPKQDPADDGFAAAHGAAPAAVRGSSRITRAGFPATIVYAGTSSVTTERAPTIEPSPMVTPGSTHTSKPIHTLSC